MFDFHHQIVTKSLKNPNKLHLVDIKHDQLLRLQTHAFVRECNMFHVKTFQWRYSKVVSHEWNMFHVKKKSFMFIHQCSMCIFQLKSFSLHHFKSFYLLFREQRTEGQMIERKNRCHQFFFFKWDNESMSQKTVTFLQLLDHH